MKQSELHVFYLWASHNKVDKQLPLPCEECSVWHCRLDQHLYKKHKMGENGNAEETKYFKGRYLGS